MENEKKASIPYKEGLMKKPKMPIVEIPHDTSVDVEDLEIEEKLEDKKPDMRQSPIKGSPENLFMPS